VLLVAGRSSPPDEDLDDWFAEAEPARPSRETRTERDELPPASEREGDDWLTGGDARADGDAGSGLLYTLSEWRVVIGIVVLAALLLAVLAVAGVFSAAQHKPTAVTTSTTASHATTPARTTTTATTPAAGASGPTATLKPGDHGSEVTALQQALNRLGYPIGTVDGVYGPATQAALARFQTASRLTSDGVFGPATLAALTSALQGP
jgi:Putative peptidoglycan binding domain